MKTTNYHTKLKAYSLAIASLKKQIEAKRKLELRTKDLNRRFLIEEERSDLTKLIQEINILRNNSINI